MKKYICLFFILSTLTSCYQAPILTYNMQNNFDFDQAERLMKKGKNTVIGNAFLRQNGGGIVTCAGSEVTLIPATEYAKERLRRLYSGTDKGYNPIVVKGFLQYGPLMQYEFIPTPNRYSALMKRTVCDSTGHFKFTDITDGEFFVTTSVVWQVPSQNGMVPNGGSLMQRVVLQKGETKEIIMNH